MNEENRIKKFANIPASFLKDDFKFIVSDTHFMLSRLLALFISPIISHIQITDPTYNEFHIECKGIENEAVSGFEAIIRLLEQGISEISDDHIDGVVHCLRKLGNSEIASQVLIHDISNAKELLYEDEFNFVDYESIDFIANNIEDISIQNFSNSSLDTMSAILMSEMLSIPSEDWLLDFVSDLTQVNKKFASLISFINFFNLSSENMKRYFSLFDYYQNFSSEFLFNTKYLLVPEVVDLQHEEPIDEFKITMEPDPDFPFHGLINYLSKEIGENLIDCGIVKARESSCYVGELRNLFDYEDFTSSSCWALTDELDGYFELDFIDSQIEITHYAIHTLTDYQESFYQPKNWTLEGSNDKKNWIVLDMRENDASLHGRDKSHIFKCFNSHGHEQFRYIRLYQRGPSHNAYGWNYLYMSGLEFFGTIHSSK